MRAGKLRDKPAGSWVWPFPPSTKQAQTPSLLHYAIAFNEIFELCMHFYIVISYLSQLDLHLTLNAASRKHLLKSWDKVMLYLLLFMFIRKKVYIHARIFFFYYWCILVLSQQSFHAELWIHALFILNSTAEMQHFIQWLQYADC